MKSKSAISGILTGAVVLLFANIIVKILGFIYKIPLQRLLTDVGMGYFNAAYNIYTWFYLVCTAGLPIAVSVCVAKAISEHKPEKCTAVFRSALYIFSCFGFICSFLMIVFCRRIASAASIGKAYMCIAAIAPSVFISCITASIRGYYQGHGIMWVTAASQLLEGAGKLVFGILFINISIKTNNDLYMTAAGASAGISCGALLSAVFCIVVKSSYIRPAKRCKTPLNRVIFELAGAAVPITAAASVMNLVSLSDVFTAPHMLRNYGFSEIQATQIYGNYSTVCISLINLPMVFVYPVCSAMLPRLTAAVHSKDKAALSKIASLSYKAIFSVIFPSAVGLGIMSYQTSLLIFPSGSALLASPMLTVLAPSLIFHALLALTDTALQSAGKAGKTVISMLAGLSAKLISSFLFFRFTNAGILSIPAGTCICYIVSASMNLLFLKKTSVISKAPSSLLKPAVCAVICGLAAHLSFRYLSMIVDEYAASALSVVVAVIVYFAALIISGFIKKSDVKILAVINNRERNHNNDRIREKREV